MAVETVRFRLGDDPPPRLDKALSACAPPEAALSRSRLAKLIAEGAVRVGGQVATDPAARSVPGAEVEIALSLRPREDLAAEPIPIAVLHEDSELIVIDKPAGMAVHPAPGTPSGTLVNALMWHCGDSLSGIGGEERPGIVHRLDKDTSGVLVAAKTDHAHQELARQFAAHSVERLYRAAVHGVPNPAEPRLLGIAGVSAEPGGVLRISAPLGRHPQDRQRQAVRRAGGRHAVTRARVAEVFGTPPAAALLECWLETGRTHQIRVHLAHVGHVLIGDPLYGGRRKLSARALPPGAAEAAAGFPRQALHAAVLGFRHPSTGAAIRFEAPLPPDMAGLLAALRGERADGR
ncbi:RNA pseudouridine synthase [Rhodosalinus halophilus]|uniref:Pseudouridine synthase n=1 Tax=Rhodosalinus halophilus TaxID=2259333 RepID=A0A365U6X1_9RHOB|nr:RluA family pseudouridine synthase [Rhodosalinus halophilus]RBI84251.1 RNA pseudouridine synthase [Rhodosalinus halophilus]